MTLSLTLTPDTVTASVAVLLSATGADTAYWPSATIARSVDGQQPVTIRGAAGVDTSGGLLYIVDNEAPFGVELTYTATNPIGGTVTATESLDVTSTWIKVPGHADLGITAVIANHDRVDAYGTPTGVFPIVGSRLPVTVSGTTSARTSAVKLLTTSRAGAAQLLRALQTSPVILIETPAGHALERGYFTITGFSRQQVARASADDGSIWELPLIEVGIPSGGSASGGITWDTLAGTYATWTALRVGLASWLDVVSS